MLKNCCKKRLQQRRGFLEGNEEINYSPVYLVNKENIPVDIVLYGKYNRS